MHSRPPSTPLKLMDSSCYDLPMPHASDAFLAELALKRADRPVHEWGDEPEYRSSGQFLR